MARQTFTIIGPGRLGISIAHALVEAGWVCCAVRARKPEDLRAARSLIPGDWIADTWADPKPWPPAGVMLLTVSDREIVRVGGLLGGEGSPSADVVLHTSGLHTSADLEPCRGRGMAAGSCHPLQTFPRRDTPPGAFRGVFCAVEGDPAAVAAAARLARTLGMHPWEIAPDSKPLYHAAAVVAANLTHILIAEAKELLAQAGLDRDDAGSAIGPLVRASVEAALAAGGLEALTGPLVRGDRTTVEAHLSVLPAPLAEAYAAIARLAYRGEDGRQMRGRSSRGRSEG